MTLSRRSLALASLVLLFSVSAFASDGGCTKIKGMFEAGTASSQEVIKLQELVAKGSLCGKNLFGRLLATGRLGEVDLDRAYAIFYDLAQKEYPPSQLNLGILLSKKDDQFRPDVPMYLLGIFASYYGNKEWGDVGSSARDAGRAYLKKHLESASNDATAIVEAQRMFELGIQRATSDTAAALLAREQYLKDRNDAIAGILSLGAAVAAAPSLHLFGPPPPPPMTVARMYQLGILQ